VSRRVLIVKQVAKLRVGDTLLMTESLNANVAAVVAEIEERKDRSTLVTVTTPMLFGLEALELHPDEQVIVFGPHGGPA
jgi:16S rRNA U1498 N3-methylase RsmE